MDDWVEHPTPAEREAILTNQRPPQIVIDEAIRQANLSPCEKSKRGVVLYNDEIAHNWAADPVSLRIADSISFCPGRGFNGPPKGFTCPGVDQCGSSCGRLCLHAEDRAIRDAGILDDVVDLIAVHVKVVDGKLVAGGPPGCELCSKVIVEVRLKGIWLYEAQRWHDELRCRACSRITFIAQGGGTTGVCGSCAYVGNLLEMPGRRVYHADSGAWRYYEGVNFHKATLLNLGLPFKVSS